MDGFTHPDDTSYTYLHPWLMVDADLICGGCQDTDGEY